MKHKILHTEGHNLKEVLHTLAADIQAHMAEGYTQVGTHTLLAHTVRPSSGSKRTCVLWVASASMIRSGD